MERVKTPPTIIRAPLPIKISRWVAVRAVAKMAAILKTLRPPLIGLPSEGHALTQMVKAASLAISQVKKMPWLHSELRSPRGTTCIDQSSSKLIYEAMRRLF